MFRLHPTPGPAAALTQDPVGFWDPLGFTASGDVTAFRRRRSVELKHGRISMLATMGYITPESLPHALTHGAGASGCRDLPGY